MDFIPRAFAIKYCDILNNMVLDFFQDHGDFFSRTENGTYVFSGKNAKTRLAKIFTGYFSHEMENIASSIRENYKDIATRHVFILQGSSPENNVLQNEFTGKIVPSRYFLTEADIQMDFVLLEKIWDGIFDSRFRIKQIKGRNNGIMFLRNQNLNADQIGNILKLVYGEVRFPYQRRKDILEDLSETTYYKFDGSKTMHDKLKMIVAETKDYIRQITHLKE